MSTLAEFVEEEYTDDGEIPAGFLFASVKNIGDQMAYVNGAELEPGEAKTYPFVGKPCQPIPYETNGSVLRIMWSQ